MSRIAVAGCGIAGTAVASQLAEAGHDVTLFEQADQCRPVGAGIMLQQSGQEVLRSMGLLDAIEASSAKLHGMTAQWSSGKTLVSLDFSRRSPESCALGVHRGRLFQCLLERCRQSGVHIVLQTQVAGFDSKTGVVQFNSHPNPSPENIADTENSAATEYKEGTFEFLIAADGSRSKLRSASSIPCSVKDYDFGAFWTTGPCDFQTGELFQVVEGTHTLSGLLPIGNGESSFFWGLPLTQWPHLKASNLSNWKSDVLRLFPQAESILHSIDSFDSVTFGTYRNVAMKRWFDDRIVFIGDAAHATSPHLGQGVNLALEDAYEFSASLRASDGDFQQACVAYTRKRRSKLRFYQQLTKFLTPFFQSHGRLRGMMRDAALPWLPGLPWVGSEMLRTLSGTKNGWLR